MRSSVVRQAGLKCLRCKDKLFSDFRHDFKYCSCKSCFVDGGFDYFRCGYDDKAKTKVVYRRVSRGPVREVDFHNGR